MLSNIAYTCLARGDFLLRTAQQQNFLLKPNLPNYKYIFIFLYENIKNFYVRVIYTYLSKIALIPCTIKVKRRNAVAAAAPESKLPILTR